MPLATVNPVPNQIAQPFSDAFNLVNNGAGVVYLAAQSSVTNLQYEYALQRGQSMQWNGGTELWAVCAPGESASLNWMYGASNTFSPAPDVVEISGGTIEVVGDITGAVSITNSILNIAGTVGIDDSSEVLRADTAFAPWGGTLAFNIPQYESLFVRIQTAPLAGVLTPLQLQFIMRVRDGITIVPGNSFTSTFYVGSTVLMYIPSYHDVFNISILNMPVGLQAIISVIGMKRPVQQLSVEHNHEESVNPPLVNVTRTRYPGAYYYTWTLATINVASTLAITTLTGTARIVFTVTYPAPAVNYRVNVLMPNGEAIYAETLLAATNGVAQTLNVFVPMGGVRFVLSGNNGATTAPTVSLAIYQQDGITS